MTASIIKKLISPLKKINLPKPNSPSSTNDEPIKLVLAVRTDLNMGKGKIASQCAHAAVEAYRKTRTTLATKQWLNEGQTKVVVKIGSLEELHSLKKSAQSMNIPCITISDAGRTQIESGSLTVAAIGPAKTSLVNQVCGSLKLL